MATLQRLPDWCGCDPKGRPGGGCGLGLLELYRVRNLLYWSFMRVRILKPFAGMIDGISLGTLVPGLTYDLPHELAQRLIIEKSHAKTLHLRY